jgi:putative PIN family toxin of toxin-antitoxin system
MKFVLDTNVLIAAFITSGICHEVLEHVIRNHKLVLSDFIVDEFKDKLLNKFQYTEKEADAALKLLLTRAEMVQVSPLQSRVCRDPDDDNILATAVSANSDCIISGDNDLVNLRQFQNIKIIRPSEFSRFEATLK